MRILLAENNSDVAQSLESFLQNGRYNHNVETTALVEKAIELGKLHEYDIILLNRDLKPEKGDGDGLRVIKALRTAGIKTPMIMYGPDDDLSSTVTALGHGADDYMRTPAEQPGLRLIGPVDGRELLARINAVVRRCCGSVSNVIERGDLAVDIGAGQVTVKREPAHLSKKEYTLLEYMAVRPGRVLIKENVLLYLYGEADASNLKNLHVLVCNLRKKLAQAAGDPNYNQIETVWGRGFILHDKQMPVQNRKPKPQSCTATAA